MQAKQQNFLFLFIYFFNFIFQFIIRWSKIYWITVVIDRGIDVNSIWELYLFFC